ncbi:MAG: Uma2 family endonuclease [Spirochaetota bacterium]
MPRTRTNGTSAIKPDKHYTYADYKTWPEDERWELIDGKAYPLFGMSPAPRRRHQAFSGRLFSQLDRFFEGKPCSLYDSPIDVFLPEGDEALGDIDKVVQPDLLVVCDRTKLIDEGIRGAPDFIIEILSPGTAMVDQTEKRQLYEKHGVREYWIVNPETFEVLQYRSTAGVYGLPSVADLRQPCPVAIFEGLILKVRAEDF